MRSCPETTGNTGRCSLDGHSRVVDPRFPLRPREGLRPERFTLEDDRGRLSAFTLVGGAEPGSQGFEQLHLVNALSPLEGGFVGITQLPASATEDEIVGLNLVGNGLQLNRCR